MGSLDKRIGEAIPATGLCTCRACVPLVKAYHDPECPVATDYDHRLWWEDMQRNPALASIEMSGMSRADLDEIRAAFAPSDTDARRGTA